MTLGEPGGLAEWWRGSHTLVVTRLSGWVFEEPRRPAENACRLARSRFWRAGSERFIGTHKDWPDASYALDLEEDFAHGFVLALSVLPAAERAAFADAFYEVRHIAGRDWIRRSLDPKARLEVSAAVVSDVVSIIERADIRTERVIDLLNGAAQGDDLSLAPPLAVDEVRKVVARVRLEPRFDDETDPQAAAAIALIEVLDPAGEVVAMKEVLARSAWAAATSWERAALLGFLLATERRIQDCVPVDAT